jgi:DNA-binding MarR family transcriptional regulator
MSRDSGPSERSGSRREAIVEEFGAAIRAYQTSNDNWDQAMAAYAGINRTDARCIDLIDQAGGMTAGELARAAGLTSGAVTAVLDRLERAGLAWRVRDEGDRRRVRIEATPKVWETAEPLMAPFLRDAATILDDYTDAEITRFAEFLRRVVRLQSEHLERVRAR